MFPFNISRLRIVRNRNHITVIYEEDEILVTKELPFSINTIIELLRHYLYNSKYTLLVESNNTYITSIYEIERLPDTCKHRKLLTDLRAKSKFKKIN